MWLLALEQRLSGMALGSVVVALGSGAEARWSWLWSRGSGVMALGSRAEAQ